MNVLPTKKRNGQASVPYDDNVLLKLIVGNSLLTVPLFYSECYTNKKKRNGQESVPYDDNDLLKLIVGNSLPTVPLFYSECYTNKKKNGTDRSPFPTMKNVLLNISLGKIS